MANIISQFINDRKMIKLINKNYGEFNRLIEDKEYDIANNKKVLDAYVANDNTNFYFISLLLKAGVDVNTIAAYQKCKEIIIEDFIKTVNDGDIVHYRNNSILFDSVINNENINNIIPKLSINAELFDENILEHWSYSEFSYILDIARKGGYVPLKSGLDINFFFDDNMVDKQETFQKLGLMNAYIYNELYKCKIKKYLEWISNGHVGPAPSADIIEMKFENLDEPARYWLNQSKMLGNDAIDVVMKYIARNMQLDDINGLFDDSLIPTEKFFKTEKRGFPTRVASGNTEYFSNSYNKRLETLYFLCNNAERYEGIYKTFFKLLNSYKRGKQHSDIISFLEYLGIGFNRDCIDDVGLTEKAYSKALLSLDRIKIIKELDPNYLEHYNVKQLSYIKLMENNSRLLSRLVDNSGHKYNEFIELYVDKTGLNQEFYDYFKYRYLFKYPNIFSAFFDGWERYFKQSELQYIKYSLNHSFLIDESIYKNCDLYFDSNGFTSNIVFYYFNSFKYDNLLDIIDSVDSSLIDYLDDKGKKILLSYKNADNRVKSAYLDYIKENYDSINIIKINEIEKLLTRLMLSNSSEIINFMSPILSQLLNNEDPFKALEEIEDIFINNNIPTVGKIYSVFDILHPNCSGFNIENSSTISPTLISKSTLGRKLVIFSDLIKSAFGSNNRSVISYLKNIEIGNELYKMLISSQINYEELDEKSKKELISFSKHLYTLYKNSLKGKKDVNSFELGSDVVSNISHLVKLLSVDSTMDYNIADRIVSMFCHMAGIDTLEDAKNYIKEKIESADSRNRLASRRNMILEKGDFIKGIGNIKYLENILQNGSVSKEFLGSSADSDATPLDTDVTMILDSSGTIRKKISSSISSSYGPIYLVLKNDGRFNITRSYNNDMTSEKDSSKLEAFYTGWLGNSHYGIRTGFASSEINYIVMDEYDERVGLEIVLNGFYIPVVDMDGKTIFTPEDYDRLREKMNGLSNYGISEYKVSSSIKRNSDEITNIIDDMEFNKAETCKKANLIKQSIQNGLKSIGLKVLDSINLSNNSVVLFNTGSTGRYTNLPGDGDFDYTMQVDREIYSNEDKMDILRNKILKSFGDNVNALIIDGDIRELKAKVTDENGITHDVEIDITFTQKTDKAEYASDACVCDRLNSIKSEEERKLVKANIILAKQFLKSIEAYKPARRKSEQGGMGGIGVENWILQNGGTLYSAAKSFMDAADKCSSFEEFCKIYSLPNFGYNHMALKKGFYPHDDYIKNMNSTGYEKMKVALREYINNYDKNLNNPVIETISQLQNDSSKIIS